MRKLINKIKCFFSGHEMVPSHEPIHNDFGWEQHWHCFHGCGKKEWLQVMPDGTPLRRLTDQEIAQRIIANQIRRNQEFRVSKPMLYGMKCMDPKDAFIRNDHHGVS